MLSTRLSRLRWHDLRQSSIGRRAVADQMYPGILCHLCSQPTGHRDAAALFAQHQRRQMIERAAKPGASEDHISMKHVTVLPAHSIVQNLAEHWQPLEHPALAHGQGSWREGQPRD